MINRGPPFFPKRRMRHIKPCGRHRDTAESANPLLPGPQRFVGFRGMGREWLAHNALGRVHPRRAQAARTVLRSKQAIVIGPTPPGTGVICPVTLAQES